uniref:Protein SMG5 n=1 Tax=Lygus hesperus TaxID=30085 RepID=A0A0A9WHW3_LYGHE
MKKSQSSLPERSDSADLPLKLYRAISDAVRHLENQRARTEHVSDLFADTTEALRMKIRDYGDRLMFTDPVAYGKKAEDLVWRKVFYETVATVKKLNKNVKMEPRETFMIQTHLQSGVGFYHHIIMKLQSQFRLDLRGVVDFPLLVTDCGLNKGKTCWSSKLAESLALEWAHSALHRCLICLGDICRYLSDLEPTYDHNNALRYYVQALNWKPDYGMPHNQLGTLAANNNFSLDAAYHYMRCLCCKERFDGAEGNLLRLMENNALSYQELFKDNFTETNVKKLILAFIHLSCSLFYDKPIPQMNQLCSEVFSELESCMAETETNVIHLMNTDSGEPSVLNDDILFKMLIMSIMCVQELQSKNSSQTVTALALCLSLISQLLQICIQRIEMVITPRRNPVAFKKSLVQPRRRKRRGRLNSDMSEDENESVYSLDSDISEEELIFDQFLDSEDEHLVNGKMAGNKGQNGLLSSKPRTDYDSNMPWDYPIIATDKCFQHIHKLSHEGYIFQTLKVAFYWIDSNKDVLKSFAPASTPFFSRLLTFLNHLSSVPSHAYLKEHFDDEIISEDLLCTIPLPEDVTVRGLTNLDVSHSNINWEYFRTRHLKPTEETYSRMVGFLKIGRLICDEKISPITYDATKQWFSLPQTNGVNGHLTQNTTGVSSDTNGRVANGKPSNGVRSHVLVNNIVNDQRQNGKTEPVKVDRKGSGSPWEADPARVEKLMHNMGELWLKSEVSQLEDRTRKGMKENLPPYIVPDAEAFINHSSLIKQLISVKKFIVLIPSVVVSALDECKQCSNKVRDTIRWLEWQLRNGKRNIRLQRPNEHQPIPFIKYPKKKDKEAWMFLQVVECCNYLCNQSTGEKNPELVTLLTGSKLLMPNSNHTTNGFSHFGVAKSAGINVEHIETFFSKWKSSSKSHG